MKPVHQTILHSEEIPGNCFQACIASILEMNIDDVPHFMLYRSEWYDEANKWLIDRAGVFLEHLDCDCHIPPLGYAILTGKSPRGINHSVVIKNGEMVHDPHPDGGGIVEERHYIAFVSMMDSVCI